MTMPVAATILKTPPENAPSLILGGGCFWCLESEFRRIPGILYTCCGYAGGTTANPRYEDICTGKTGHAEVVEIFYDPAALSLEDILAHFLKVAHNPTELNRQGVDIGSQYRSVIFFKDDAQQKAAKDAIDSLKAEDYWHGKTITTKLEPLITFWPAEPYHQQYYEHYSAKTGMDHIRARGKIAKWEKQG